MIAELPKLTDEERWQLIDRAMELDDFSEEELKLINERISEKGDPQKWVPLDQMMARFREQGRL